MIDEQGLLLYPIIICKINLEKDLSGKMSFNLASAMESLVYISNSKATIGNGISVFNITRTPFIFIPKAS